MTFVMVVELNGCVRSPTMVSMCVAWLRGGLIGFGLLAATGVGCTAVAKQDRAGPIADFFPLTPSSRWEYSVSRGGEGTPLRFVATVRLGEFKGPNGLGCRIVDEHYGDLPAGERSPIAYCSEGGFLHRVTSLEYRGESLEDNGLRSGEIKFLPVNLGQTQAWEGRTNAYQLPDGSGFEVRQLHRVFVQREPIEVLAGRFERCARVETTAIHSATGSDGAAVGARIVYYYSDWYAPGVGLVRTEQRSATSEVLATVELVGYQIGREMPQQ
jgi:hypothetical protein